MVSVAVALVPDSLIMGIMEHRLQEPDAQKRVERAAIQRGIRNGWIDRATYEPLIQKAWTAILARTGADGRLVACHLVH